MNTSVATGSFKHGEISIIGSLRNMAKDDSKLSDYVDMCILRHLLCDWGDLDKSDIRSNELALRNGGRLFSSYIYSDDVRIWVITEYDRSRTTVLMPCDY